MMCSRRNRGFTLTELLVAIGVSIVLLAAVMYVFTNTAKAIRSGGATSELLNTVRTVYEAVQRDLDYDSQVGPTVGAHGGYMIVLNRRIDDIRLTPLEKQRSVRSDVLMFFRERGDYRPDAAGFNNSYDTRHYDAGYMRIWYGMPHLTNPDGSGNIRPHHDMRTRGGDWVLGRQILFLLDQRNADGNYLHADTNSSGTDYAALADAEVKGTTQLDSIVSGTTAIYHGYCQVAEQPLFNFVDYPGTSEEGRGIIGTNSFNHVRTGLANNSYRQQAFRYGFFDEDEWILVNQRPFSGDNQDSYGSWLLAQMHANWAEHVSEFKVEMALDTDNDGEIDVDADGNIVWYDGIDNPPDSSSWWADSGNLRTPWYPGASESGIDLSYKNGGEHEAFVFRHDDDQIFTTGAGAANNSRWPYMLRLTFRIHDPDMQIVGGDGRQGKSLEIIVPINRP